MPYLSWISDENLEKAVQETIDAADRAKKKSEKDPNRNVIDPISAIFNGCVFGGDVNDWKSRELYRQSEKGLSNSIGLFHQNILSKVTGWRIPTKDEGTFDICNEEQRIIAEVKNKYNTLKASDVHTCYARFDNAISYKNSLYYGYKAYLVTIIPKKKGTIQLTPSNNETGNRKPANPNILQIDGESFYELVTGDSEALKNLFKVLPEFLTKISGKHIDASIIRYAEELFIKIFP